MTQDDLDRAGGIPPSNAAEEDVAAAYASVASASESTTGAGPAASSGPSGLETAALSVVLQRRGVFSLVFKQLWVLMFTFLLVFLGVTFVPWSGLEDTSVEQVSKTAMSIAREWAVARGVDRADTAQIEEIAGEAYPFAFAAEVKKTHAPGYTQGRGAIIFFVSLWALGASLLGIWTNRFLLMPTAVAFLTGLIVGATRFLQLFVGEPEVRNVISSAFALKNIDIALGVVSDVFGPGYLFVMLGCLFVPVYLVMSALSGSKEAKAKATAGRTPAKAKPGASGRAGAKGRR
jgi:hypothetical protein